MHAKTSSGNRFIPLNDTARRVLMELGQARSSEYVFPSRRKPGDRLLDLKKGFKAAVKFAEIRDLRFHDLRHTVATRLVRAGVDLITVQQLLGHARISVTARYVHSLRDSRIAAVRQLEARSPVQPDPNRSQDSDSTANVAGLNPPLENNLGS